jgi:hypothetical protein
MVNVLQLTGGKLVTASDPSSWVYLTGGKLVVTDTSSQTNSMQLSSGKRIGVTGPAAITNGYPYSDEASGGFSPSTGSTLWGVLDEEPYSDSDYVSATADSGGDSFKCGISGAAGGGGTATVRVRSKCTQSGTLQNAQLTIKLIEGASTIRGQQPHELSTSFAEYTCSASSISNYSDLDVQCDIIDEEDVTGNEVHVSWIRVDPT